MYKAIRVLSILFAVSVLAACGVGDPNSEDDNVRYPPIISGGSRTGTSPGDNQGADAAAVDDVIADDPDDAEAPHEPHNPPVEEVVDGKLERGSRVKVTNVIVDGVDKRLHIREPAGIESPIIGSAADGSTGIILRGPGLGDGWEWWEILWDNNGKVAFNEGEKCCIGWSAETNRAGNVRYLTEIP